jgi:hypothetical protein
MSELYDEDVLLWSERQARLLRRRAAGELVNDAELPRAKSVASVALAEYAQTPRVPIEGLGYSKDQVLGMWFPADTR